MSSHPNTFLAATRAISVAGGSWVVRNPIMTTAAVLVLAPGVATSAALSATGFGAAGVKAHSIAAAVHGLIGAVGVGSAFAIAQSAGAGGAGLAVVHGVVQGFGVAMATVGGVLGEVR